MALKLARRVNQEASSVDDWIRERFRKRECVRIVTTPSDSSRCGCGRPVAFHYYYSDAVEQEWSKKKRARVYGDPRRQWSIDRCTATFPTDAYGTLTFSDGGRGFRKARFIRTDLSTDPEDLWRLLIHVWGLQPPTLVITIQESEDYGHSMAELSLGFVDEFKRGLSKAASANKSTWIITNGMKTGVNKQIITLLHNIDHRRGNRKSSQRIQVIGFVPWGLVRGSDQLVNGAKAGGGNDAPPVSYYGRLQQHSKPRATKPLCEGHSAFVLIDDGTIGRWPSSWSNNHADVARHRFEHSLAQWRVALTVCLVVGGSLPCLRAVLDYLSVEEDEEEDEPAAIPIVACDGTGGVAEWIARMHEARSRTEKKSATTTAAADTLLPRIARQMQTYLDIEAEYAIEMANGLFSLVQSRKTLITVYSAFRSTSAADMVVVTEDDDGNAVLGLDAAILTAALTGLSSASKADKLALVVTWGREDLARRILEDVGGVGLEWPIGSLDESMVNALVYDRVDMVNLLLANGLNMDRFLTPSRLEQLYSTDGVNPNTLRLILRDDRKRLKLAHVGRIVEKMMGAGYQSAYCRREFRRYRIEANEMAKRKGKLSPTSVQTIFTVDRRNRTIALAAHHNRPHFSTPSHELFEWAVLTNRKGLAALFWENGQEQLAKALVGSHLYQSLANAANADHLEMDMCRQLEESANEYRSLAYNLLDYYYSVDRETTFQILTYELGRFSGSTCIDLAASSRNEPFVAHHSCQLLLTNLWLGALRLRRHVSLKVIAALLFPPFVAGLTFKTVEELQLQAQTVEQTITFSSKRKHKSGWKRKMDTEECTTTSDDENCSSWSSSGTETEPEQSDNEEQDTSLPVNGLAYSWSWQFLDSDLATSDRASSFCSSLDEKSLPTTTTFRQRNYSEASLDDDVFRRTSSGYGRESEDTVSFHIDGRTNSTRITEYSASAVDEVDSANLTPLMDWPHVICSKGPLPMQQLNLFRKIREFYSAPIAAFWSFTIGYLVFLSCFTYVVLVKSPDQPQWPEYYVAAYMITCFADQIRKVLIQKPRRLQAKFSVFLSNIWEGLTMLACLVFLAAFVLRSLSTSMVTASRITYGTNITFWYLRTLRLFSVNSKLSPYIRMYGKMVSQLFLLSSILLVLLSSFGVFRQAILHPREDWSWTLLRNITYKPYAMLYGQIYPDELTECEDTGEKCTPGRWLLPLSMTAYLLLTMMVFMSMTIAEFSHIFTEISGRAQEIAKFEAYHQVMGFAQQPFLPPPLIIISHVWMIGKYVYRRFVRNQKRYRFERCLKLILTPQAAEKLHEFERDCTKELIAKKLDTQTVNGQLAQLTQRLNSMTARVDHLHEQSQLHRSALIKLQYLQSSATSQRRTKRRSLSEITVSTSP